MSVSLDVRAPLANERTLLSWIRTGLGLMAFGFVVARTGVLLRQLDPQSGSGSRLSVALGAAFILLGVISNILAARQYLVIRRSLIRMEPIADAATNAVVLTLAVAGLGLVLAIFLLNA